MAISCQFYVKMPLRYLYFFNMGLTSPLPLGGGGSQRFITYLRIWGTYDPNKSGPSEPKKWGFHRCNVKICRILDQKCSFWPAPYRQHFCVDPVARRASGRLPGPVFNATKPPIFLARTDPTQWDHKFPIS